jgi:hypothetical protein
MIVIVDHDYSLPNVCLDVYFFTIPTFQLPENSEKISGDTIHLPTGFGVRVSGGSNGCGLRKEGYREAGRHDGGGGDAAGDGRRLAVGGGAWDGSAGVLGKATVGRLKLTRCRKMSIRPLRLVA